MEVFLDSSDSTDFILSYILFKCKKIKQEKENLRKYEYDLPKFSA
jgi:hypothetical protein